MQEQSSQDQSLFSNNLYYKWKLYNKTDGHVDINAYDAIEFDNKSEWLAPSSLCKYLIGTELDVIADHVLHQDRSVRTNYRCGFSILASASVRLYDACHTEKHFIHGQLIWAWNPSC